MSLTTQTRLIPLYIALAKNGELRKRVEEAYSRLENCIICPKVCRVNRLKGELGDCLTAERAVVYSFHPHFGEEAPLVGWGGSGTIFFSHCTMACLFCQNYEISHLGEGREVRSEQLAQMMLYLQEMGCHNINLVSPSHVVPEMLVALEIAIEGGLRLPLVYNTGGYDSVATLRLLDGIVDIYMPDMKYSDETLAEKFSGARHYPRVNRAALREMHRQVGDLVIDERGVAVRGLLVRHLVLPHGLAGSEGVLRFLAEEISKNTYLNLMAQYHPCYKAIGHSLLGRRIAPGAYKEAVELADRYGLHRLDNRWRFSA